MIEAPRSSAWGACPLTSQLAVVELIAATTTKAGLTVTCELDTTEYLKGIKVTNDEMEALAITRDDFHGTTPSLLEHKIAHLIWHES